MESKKHYVDVSSFYDRVSSDYITACVTVINHQLQFTPDDTILDIGGGTAETSHRLWKMHGLKAPVVCVDPSEAMLEVARRKEGVETVLSTAEDFSAQGRVFSKILIIGCYHYFNDPGVIFTKIAEALSENGVCLVSRITSGSAPVCFVKIPFKELDFHQIAKLAESKGLKATVTLETERSRVKKETFFEFLTKRMVSSWSECTDEEIEDEIKELEYKFRGLEFIDMEYKMNLAIITK